MGFFTDTSVCIGCKACEVACKEWNARPRGRADADWDVLRQHRRPGRLDLAARRVHRADQAPGEAAVTAADGQDGSAGRARCPANSRPTVPLADGQQRVQALHRGRLPGCLPDRGADPHRVRHRGGPVGRLQRLRLLRPGLPVRGDRPARGRRPGLEVHAVLRPDRRRAGARLRQGLPDPVDPVRPGGRAARAGPAAGGGAAGRRARPAPGCTWTTRPTASAAAARSSCCWTSRRCTGCRRTRWSPPGTCRGCGGTWPPRRAPC